LVAEDETGLIGYVSGHFHAAFCAGGNTAWVDELFVKEERRGEGTGRSLMAALETRAAAGGCVLVSLATSGAGRFYSKLGYASMAGYFKEYLVPLEQYAYPRRALNGHAPPSDLHVSAGRSLCLLGIWRGPRRPRWRCRYESQRRDRRPVRRLLREGPSDRKRFRVSARGSRCKAPAVLIVQDPEPADRARNRGCALARSRTGLGSAEAPAGGVLAR